MFFATHIHIGQFLYEQLNKQEFDSFQIIKSAFVYGNVKPDITKMLFLKHQFSHIYDLFCNQVYTVKDTSLSDWDRSVALGVVAHFLCDFFCKFHAKNPYNESSKWTHFWYEWDLHITVLQDLINRNPSEKQTIADPFKYQVSFSNINGQIDGFVQGDPDFQYLVDLINRYCIKEEHTVVDKDFAFYAINKTFEKIFGFELFMSRENEMQKASYTPSPDEEFLKRKAVV
ncbi:zinc dependent phospholipase C family protein [Eubacteriaceae bacterium ES3]|nr:zinc dependent phospholipase C family protein [Eubacteriaceae bacterium ES3]